MSNNRHIKEHKTTCSMVLWNGTNYNGLIFNDTLSSKYRGPVLLAKDASCPCNEFHMYSWKMMSVAKIMLTELWKNREMRIREQDWKRKRNKITRASEKQDVKRWEERKETNKKVKRLKDMKQLEMNYTETWWGEKEEKKQRASERQHVKRWDKDKRSKKWCKM